MTAGSQAIATDQRWCRSCRADASHRLAQFLGWFPLDAPATVVWTSPKGTHRDSELVVSVGDRCVSDAVAEIVALRMWVAGRCHRVATDGFLPSVAVARWQPLVGPSS